ncbi:MAG TPA: hypothetical protein VJ750_06440 [Rhizomicrobium sp.]|nr:hypothetical protein [Rhizomicrobium sp.]
MKKTFLLFALAWLLPAVALAAPGTAPEKTPEKISEKNPDKASEDEARHLVAEPAGEKGVVSLSSFDRRVQISAFRMRQKFPQARIERHVPFDIVYPSGGREFQQLNGHGILLVSAMTWNGEELPLARVYLLRPNGTRTVLRQLGHMRRSVAKDSAAARVFGSNREDAFYLLPLSALQGAMLVCDFGRDRNGFIITNTALQAPITAAIKNPGALPSRKAVEGVITREYPGFGIELTGLAR